MSELAVAAEILGTTLQDLLGVKRRGPLALAARVMSAPVTDDTTPARRRVRQVLEAESVLGDATGLRPLARSVAGTAVIDRARSESLIDGSPSVAGARLAQIVREELGLGYAPVADLAALCERHFGINAVTWPVGQAVSGLCVRGADMGLILVSSSFPRGHQRFTGAHELGHHILGDPREVIVEADIFAVNTAPERRVNTFAAALLMPAKGLLEVVSGRPVDKAVLAELMHEFEVSYRALLYRLAERDVGLLTAAERDKWLECTATNVLRAGGDLDPQRWTTPDERRRVPPRLWAAAQQGYRNGWVGLGVLSALLDEDPDDLYQRLAVAEILPPSVHDDLADL